MSLGINVKIIIPAHLTRMKQYHPFWSLTFGNGHNSFNQGIIMILCQIKMLRHLLCRCRTFKLRFYSLQTFLWHIFVYSRCGLFRPWISLVSPSAVLTHCGRVLPVASYPVPPTKTSLRLIGEFTVNSGRGHSVPPLLPPTQTQRGTGCNVTTGGWALQRGKDRTEV